MLSGIKYAVTLWVELSPQHLVMTLLGHSVGRAYCCHPSHFALLGPPFITLSFACGGHELLHVSFRSRLDSQGTLVHSSFLLEGMCGTLYMCGAAAVCWSWLCAAAVRMQYLMFNSSGMGAVCDRGVLLLMPGGAADASLQLLPDVLLCC